MFERFKSSRVQEDQSDCAFFCIFIIMKADKHFYSFISGYSEEVKQNATLLRDIISAQLPGIIEQVDIPAKMVAYTFGPRYADMVCATIPSAKELKLGFYKGNELPDPSGLLEGSGKVSRYIRFTTKKPIETDVVKAYLDNAYLAYKDRNPVK